LDTSHDGQSDKPNPARERDRRYRERLRERKREAGTFKPHGGQKGNTNSVKHGAYGLLALRSKGRPNGNTKLGRAFRSREREYLADLGGEQNASLAERQLANDNTWCDFIIATMDFQLQGKRQLTRKGKPHPLIDLRMRVAAHRRENYKLTGVKRTPPPQMSLEQYVTEKYGAKEGESTDTEVK
jgi:hypothetical protein